MAVKLVTELQEFHEKAFLHQGDSRGGEDIAARTRNHQKVVLRPSTPSQHPCDTLELHISGMEEKFQEGRKEPPHDALCF